MTAHSLASPEGQSLLKQVHTTLAFDYDLLESVRGLTSREFARRLLGRWAFACDAHINNAIHYKLRDYRDEREADGLAQWDNYNDFIGFMKEIAANEQSMSDMGLDIKPIADEVRKLYNMRRAIHSAIASIATAGTTYEEPDIIEFFLNPKPRRDDAETVAKLEGNSLDFATNEDGVIDVEALQVHKEVTANKRQFAKKQQLVWDKRRGELSAELFRYLIVSDFGADSEDPFGDLAPTWQFKMLTAMGERYVPGVIEQAGDDYKITANELTKWRLEARPLRKALKLASEHRRFNEVREQLAG